MHTRDIKMKGSAIITCIYLTYVVLIASEKITYNGNQLWKITNDGTTLELLKSLEKENYITLLELNSTKADAMLEAKHIDKVKEKLLEHKVKYEVTIDDLQKVIDEENPKLEVLEGRKGNRMSWNYYHDLTNIHDYLDFLQQAFPKLCTVHTLGRSSEGRPIRLLKISNGKPNNKAIFIEGGIHGNEWISPASVTFIINQFVTNYDYEPSFVRDIDWYLVPVLNPDGYEYSYTAERLWSKSRSKSGSWNCAGVDLNRNWGYDWGKNGSSGDPCSHSYRGRKPFSEPETNAVAKLFINNPEVNWVGYIAIHSYGQYIIYPRSSCNANEDSDEMTRIAAEVSNNINLAGGESYTAGSRGIIYRASGVSTDWARGAQGIKYSFAIKLRDNGIYGYILPARLIQPTSQEALIAVRTIAKSIRT